MKNLHCFLIFTEHQTMQLDKAIEYYHIPLSKIVIIISIYEHLNKDLKWVDKLKNKYNNCYSILQYKVWGTKKIQYITMRKEIIKFKWDLIKLRYKVSSIYSSLYVDIAFVAYNVLGKPKFTLLDEGTASYGVVNTRRKKVPISFIIKESIAHLILFSYPKRVNYFSQYQLKIDTNDSIDNYKFIKKTNELSLISQSILLLGTSASEVDVISEPNYLLLVKAVKHRFPNYKLNYYPHRFERKEKLMRIVQLGFNVQKNTEPFELLFSKFIKCPEIVLCFASPILGNILQMYTATPKFIMIKPPQTFYLKNASIYMDIYDNYSNYKEIEIWSICK